MVEQTADQARKEYRQQLLEYERESRDSYDKTLITLASGALGISFAFVGQFVHSGPNQGRPLLTVAWILWVATLLSVLVSYATSARALRSTIVQIDQGKELSAQPGGWLNKATGWLNVISGLSFVLGVMFMLWFALANL